MTRLNAKAAVQRLGAVFSAVVFLAALFVLHRVIGRFDFPHVLAVARGYPSGTLVAAVLLAAASYVSLSGFDLLALRHLRRDVPKGWTALISFVSHAVSHNAGFAVLTGGSVRLRMYSACGLAWGDVAGVIAFAGLTFALGTAVLAGSAFVWHADKVAPLMRLPPWLVFAIGLSLLGGVAVWLAWTGWIRRPLSIGRLRLASPTFGIGLGQIVVAAADLSFVAAALYVLLPLGNGISYPTFVGLYVVATLAGILSHVPGGLGVFEGALVLLLPEAPPDALFAALLVFRVVYNLLPLMLAALILAVFELIQRRRRVASQPAWLTSLGPALCAVLAFGAGGVLLITGALAVPSTMPRPLAEGAHLLGGAVGAALMATARGVARQRRWAWRIALGGAALGAWLALLRGPDWIPAGALAVVTAVLAASAPLFDDVEDVAAGTWFGWIGASAALLLAAFWLTLHGHGLLGHPGRITVINDVGARALRADAVAAIALATAWISLKIPGAAAGPATSAPRP